MEELKKVIWAEGVFLGQQHFQQWDRYHESQRRMLARTINPFSWGLLSMDYSKEALSNAQFRLKSCEAVFPDGRFVAYDGRYAEPLVCDLTKATGERAAIYLALPDNNGVRGIAGYQEAGGLLAWSAVYEDVPDEHDAARKREVLLGRPNLHLLLDFDGRKDYVAIKLMEVARSGDGGFVPDADFMPAVCRIGASTALVESLRRIHEMVAAKVRILAERRKGFGGIADFGPNELSQFLLLQTLRPALSLLNHFRARPEMHPEPLYRELATLASALVSFRPDAQVSGVPPYAHHSPHEVFPQLESMLQALLADVMPQPMAGLKLERETDALYHASGVGGRVLDRCSLFLAALHESDDPGWIAMFGRQVKVGAREDIEMIVGSALTGVRLVHTQRPPNRLPIKSGYEYFRVEPRGEFWERVEEHQTLSVFLPRDFMNTRIELVAVEE